MSRCDLHKVKSSKISKIKRLKVTIPLEVQRQIMHRIDMQIFCQGNVDVCKYMIKHKMLRNPQHALQYATVEGWVALTSELLASGVAPTPQALILTDHSTFDLTPQIRLQAVETCIRSHNISRAKALFRPGMVLSLCSAEWNECIQILCMKASDDVLHLYEMDQSPTVLTWLLYWGVVYSHFTAVDFAMKHGGIVNRPGFEMRVARTQDLRIFELYMKNRQTPHELENNFSELFDDSLCFGEKCRVEVIDVILTRYIISADQRIKALQHVCAGDDIEMLKCFLRQGIKPLGLECTSVLNTVRKDGLNMYHLLMQKISENDTCEM